MIANLKYINDETGASAAEYALILALVAAVIVLALTALGGAIGNKLNEVSGDINNAGA